MKLDEVVTIDQGAGQFVRWALEAIGASVNESDRDNTTFDIPEKHRAFFRGAKAVQLVGGNGARLPDTPAAIDQPDRPASPATRVPVDQPLLHWLLEQLRFSADVPSAVPTLPAVRVHEISARLFQAYTVDGGTLHLSGCTLEDRPVLRQSWLVPGEDQPRLAHRFTDPQGDSLPEAEVAALGLHCFVMPAGSLPRLAQADVRAWCAAAQQHSVAADDPIPAHAVASVIWCQFAAGKIEFMIGNAVAEVAFSGWARQLVTGHMEPPPFQCPVTGIRSHAIAVTDDGQLTVREAIQTCAISGRRVLSSELEQCADTGQTVLSEYLVTCPVSGQRVVDSVLASCGTCQQQVSPASLERGICSACRSLVPIRKDDPRMARVLGEYPRLDRWRNWRIGETSTSYVLVAAALIKRVLVVVNKESLEIVRLATRNRFSSRWAEPPLTERQELLR